MYQFCTTKYKFNGFQIKQTVIIKYQVINILGLQFLDEQIVFSIS